jgi:hypothetical protein
MVYVHATDERPRAVGQFADWTKVTPPKGTEGLCETRPPSERPGTDFYVWSAGSPAQRTFGPPNGSGLHRRRARHLLRALRVAAALALDGLLARRAKAQPAPAVPDPVEPVPAAA